MIIPLALFYYLYLAIVLVFLLLTFFNFYHLLRFGSLTLTTGTITALYLLVAAGIFLLSSQLISQINWQQTIELLPVLE